MNVINEILDVIVIGAGQAGLACGWHLQQQNLRFLILDAERSPGGNWRNYYDSLKLFLQLLTRHCQACASRQNLIITRFVMMSYAIWKTMQRHSDCQFVSTPACSMYEGSASCFSFKRTMEKFSAPGRWSCVRGIQSAVHSRYSRASGLSRAQFAQRGISKCRRLW